QRPSQDRTLPTQRSCNTRYHSDLNQTGGTNMSNDYSVCLSFDFDGMSSWIGSWQSNNPCMISRGEFATIGLDRILKLLSRYHTRGTFFIPGHTAWAWPDLVKRIADEGHEIGHHGWVHE